MTVLVSHDPELKSRGLGRCAAGCEKPFIPADWPPPRWYPHCARVICARAGASRGRTSHLRPGGRLLRPAVRCGASENRKMAMRSDTEIANGKRS